MQNVHNEVQPGKATGVVFPHKRGSVRVRTAVVFTLGLVLALQLVGLGSDSTPLGVEVQPTGKLSIEIKADRGKFGATYTVGEQIRVLYQVTTSQPVSCVYVYLFDVDSQGVVHQLFPNAFSSHNCVKPGQQLAVPDNADYELQVVPPMGQESIQAFASLRPLDVKKLGGGGQFPLIGQTVEQARNSVESAIQGVIPVKKSPGKPDGKGRLATDHTSFRVVN